MNILIFTPRSSTADIDLENEKKKIFKRNFSSYERFGCADILEKCFLDEKVFSVTCRKINSLLTSFLNDLAALLQNKSSNTIFWKFLTRDINF